MPVAAADSAIRTNLPPFSKDELEVIATDYFRDGFRLIRNVLNADEVAALKEAVDRVFANPKYKTTHNIYPFADDNSIAVRLFECDEIFEQMLAREPLISLIEHILGDTCGIL